MAFNNAITHQQMQQLAALDALTGIYNRRFGYNRIQEEFSRAIRAGSALSLIMLDIDHFKAINDT
jgi:diguanylate cyclase (GGDEF)-like protein